MSGADSRVSIPNNVRKVIHEIKKTVGSKHSEDFVYTTLKDCDMDPDEASQRLKMIHDIIEIAGKHSVEDVYTMLKDCNMDPNEAAQRLLYIDTFHEVKKKRDRQKSISSDTSEEYRRTQGNQWRGAKGGRGTFYTLKVFDDVGGRTFSSGKGYGVTNLSERGSRPPMPINPGKENSVARMANSAAANVNGASTISNGSYSHKLAPQVAADVSPCTPDPVMGPFQSSKQTCAVGTIKCEIVKCRGSTESNARLPAVVKSSAEQVAAGTIPEAVDSADTRQLKSDVVENNQIPMSLQPSSLSTQNGSKVVKPNQDNQPPQLSNEPERVPRKESELKDSAPKLDQMLQKLTLSSSHQAVIFPDHLQVPESFKTQFTFGSLDVTPDDPISLSTTESTQENYEVVTEPSPSGSNQNVVKTAQEGKFQDHPLPHLSENVLPSQDDISSDPALKDNQTKLETIPPLGEFQNPVLQMTRDYGFGLMPHLMGPHFVQLDVPDLQSGNSLFSSTSGPTATQPATAGHNSIALSPPVFPYFRPYPNYIPYNPYFPHMYFPQNAHLFNHGVFPHQPPSGLKFPVPSHYKQGNGAGSEDLNESQTKDNNNNNHYAVQQGEDVANLQPNYFYNFPHGPQHMAFGLYHSTQTMPPVESTWNNALLNRETT